MLGTVNPDASLAGLGQATPRTGSDAGRRAVDLQVLPEKGMRGPLGADSWQDTPASTDMGSDFPVRAEQEKLQR